MIRQKNIEIDDLLTENKRLLTLKIQNESLNRRIQELECEVKAYQAREKANSKELEFKEKLEVKV